MAHLAETFDKETRVYCDRYISPALISLNFSSQEKCMRHVHGVSLCPAEATRIAVCVHSTVTWCTWTLRPLAGVVCQTDRTRVDLFSWIFLWIITGSFILFLCTNKSLFGKLYIVTVCDWHYHEAQSACCTQQAGTRQTASKAHDVAVRQDSQMALIK